MKIIGLDLGGSNLRAGVVVNGKLQSVIAEPVCATGSSDEVLRQVFGVIDKIISDDTVAIGVGAPGLVDPFTRILHDVVNIPSWQEIDLRALLEERYRLPVKIENDANCFALGEYHFGSGKNCTAMAGLTIGTGLGAGIIIDKKLFCGRHGGAGELGMIKYRDHNLEYYVSGRFFENIYQINGGTVYERALMGDPTSLDMYKDFGYHLGEALKTILYILDVDCFVIGGSVKNAFPFFSATMWESASGFEYRKAIDTLKIGVSALTSANILGAAALHFYND